MVRPELAQLAVALDPLRPHSETRATARKAIRASPRRYDQMRPIPRRSDAGTASLSGPLSGWTWR